MQNTRTNPSEITLSDQTFNRLTFVRLGEEKTPGARQYIYDGRGYKFVHYPKTGDILTEGRDESVSHIDASILFGAWDDSDEKWFAFFSADCFDPPFYLVNARSWEDAYESFTDEFIDAIKVDDLEHELELEAKDTLRASPSAVEWENLLETERQTLLKGAEEEMTENGVISYNPSGKPYWAESIQGFELSLVKAEKV